MKLEWCTDADAEAIQGLLAQDGLHIKGADWTGIAGHWLVARLDSGGVMACLCVSFGKPIARLDFLSIDNGITGLSRVRLVAAILKAAIAVCLQRGATFAAGLIPYMTPEYSAFLVKRGGRVINEGQLVITPLFETLEAIGGRRIKDDDDSHDLAGREGVSKGAD